METLVLPDIRYLEQQFEYLEVFLGGARTLRFQLMKGNDNGININVAATAITKRLVEIYKKPNGVHPYILHYVNLLRDTIFTVHPDLLIEDPDVSVIKSDKQDMEKYMNTKVFDNKTREHLDGLVTEFKMMIQKHREYVDSMERDIKIFNSLKEGILSRKRSIRKYFHGNKNVALTRYEDVKLEFMYKRDIRLAALKKALRLMGFQALRRYAATKEKTKDLETELLLVQDKILLKIEDTLRLKLTKAMAQLIKIHELKCIPQLSQMKMNQRIKELTDNFEDIIGDIIESYSKEYSLKMEDIHNRKLNHNIMKNIPNVAEFLMGKTLESADHYTKNTCEMKTTCAGDDYLKNLQFNTNDARFVRANQQKKLVPGSFLEKSKGKEIRQKLVIGNLAFGWVKPSKFSSKRQYGFYSTKDVIPCQN